jgi:hypothetical protein
MSITVDVAVSDRAGSTATASVQVATATGPPVTRITGHVGMSETLTVAAGEILELDPGADTHLEFTAGSLVLRGTLRSKPAHARITHRITFTGVDEAAFIGGGMDVLPESDRGLWITEYGTLDLHGTPRTTWRRAAAGLQVGDRQILLDGDIVGWQVGDELVVSPTSQPTVFEHWKKYDYPKVSGGIGRLVSLDRPLAHEHPRVQLRDGRLFGAEVINLTKNVRVEGTAAGRSHVTSVHGHGASQQWSDVAFRYLGPRQMGPENFTVPVLGRYGPHFHHAGDGSRGSRMDRLIFRDMGSHSAVTHESHGVTWTDCVAHNVYEDPYWYDLGSTRVPQPPSHNLSYLRCGASLVQSIPATRGYTMSGFLLGNGDGNRAAGCFAVGVQGNAGPSGRSSGFIWPEGAGIGSGLWTFDTDDGMPNVSHNNKVAGAFVWQNGHDRHKIASFVAYHNGVTGLIQGAYVNGYRWGLAEPGPSDVVVLHGNGQSAMDLHSNTHGSAWEENRAQTFDRVVFDAVGLSDYAVRVVKHTKPPGGPTVLTGCTLAGYRKAAVGFVYIGAESTADRLDIVDCQRDERLPWVEFLAPLMPGSLVRVIENGQVVDEWEGPDASSDSPRG